MLPKKIGWNVETAKNEETRVNLLLLDRWILLYMTGNKTIEQQIAKLWIIKSSRSYFIINFQNIIILVVDIVKVLPHDFLQITNDK